MPPSESCSRKLNPCLTIMTVRSLVHKHTFHISALLKLRLNSLSSADGSSEDGVSEDIHHKLCPSSSSDIINLNLEIAACSYICDHISQMLLLCQFFLLLFYSVAKLCQPRWHHLSSMCSTPNVNIQKYSDSLFDFLHSTNTTQQCSLHVKFVQRTSLTPHSIRHSRSPKSLICRENNNYNRLQHWPRL